MIQTHPSTTSSSSTYYSLTSPFITSTLWSPPEPPAGVLTPLSPVGPPPTLIDHAVPEEEPLCLDL